MQSRPAAPPAPLGSALVAMRVHGEVCLPPGCVELVFSAAGQARRAPHSRAGKGEVAFAYHPGPYETVFAPFAGAPEIGLRLRYLVDATDPRVAQQRFDLFLFSEAEQTLPVETLHQAIAAAVRAALAQGVLDLPACTTLDEWHGFRAGINELLYTRFGLTVDDCVPVDLGDVCDYAALLRARAAPAADGAVVAVRTSASGQAPGDTHHQCEQAAGDLAAAPASALGRHSDDAATVAAAAVTRLAASGPESGLPAGAGNVDAAAAGQGKGATGRHHTSLPPAPAVPVPVPVTVPVTAPAAVTESVPAATATAVTAPAAAPAPTVFGTATTGSAPRGSIASAFTLAAGASDAAGLLTRPGSPDAAAAADAGDRSTITGTVAPAKPAAPSYSGAAAPSADPAKADAHALRRLFLELPAWAAGVRLLALPSGTAAARRDLLQRCALAALDVNTMPALAWAAP
ncbi:MAG: hypothetical protein K2X55_03640, partial [Burkholderiaceae bacterium]|nr:hypothetical protein [Burkholderiaceae bacterium]